MRLADFVGLAVYAKRFRQNVPRLKLKTKACKESRLTCPVPMLDVEQVFSSLLAVNQREVSIWEFHSGLLLPDLLQQSIRLVASDQRNMFVGAQLIQQRHQLMRVGQTLAL